jgi:hypothetical protein
MHNADQLAGRVVASGRLSDPPVAGHDVVGTYISDWVFTSNLMYELETSYVRAVPTTNIIYPAGTLHNHRRPLTPFHPDGMPSGCTIVGKRGSP